MRRHPRIRRTRRSASTARALTYEELARRAGRLAAVLIDEGVRPGDRVGIYMNKGLELPVALYGILRAGAAYVPIDPVSAGLAHPLHHRRLRAAPPGHERVARAPDVGARR